ncbi:TonB family protein, partial [bacterium]|nr:TonB family protein [bacterium]
AGQQSDVGKKIKKKKNVVIKSVKKKKLVSKKALPKKKLTKKSKKIASKKVKQKKVVNKLVKAKEPKAVKKTKKLEITSDKSKIAKSESPAVVKDEQVLLVGRHEMQELRVFEHLNSQVKSHWKPPIGIRQGLECTLFIDLDKQGNVIKIDVDRASGVRAFDTSARKAAKKMRYPRVLWGSRVPPLIFNS